jgi:hypothetical protein
MSLFRAVGAASAFSHRIKSNCVKIWFAPATGRWHWNYHQAFARATATGFGAGCMAALLVSAGGLPTRFAA